MNSQGSILPFVCWEWRAVFSFKSKRTWCWTHFGNFWRGVFYYRKLTLFIWCHHNLQFRYIQASFPSKIIWIIQLIMEKDLHTYSFSRGVPANRLVMTLMQFRRILEANSSPFGAWGCFTAWVLKYNSAVRQGQWYSSDFFTSAVCGHHLALFSLNICSVKTSTNSQMFVEMIYSIVLSEMPCLL